MWEYITDDYAGNGGLVVTHRMKVPNGYLYRVMSGDGVALQFVSDFFPIVPPPTPPHVSLPAYPPQGPTFYAT